MKTVAQIKLLLSAWLHLKRNRRLIGIGNSVSIEILAPLREIPAQPRLNRICYTWRS
jgi:hypothetical protein